MNTIEQVKMGAQEEPAAMQQPVEENPNDQEGDNESDVEEDSKFKSFKNVTPYDPLGTDELEGYPKFDSFERNFESSIDQITSDIEKKDIIKKKKGRKSRTDSFNKTITEIMRFDQESNKIMDNIRKDMKNNKLSNTGKVYFVSKD